MVFEDPFTCERPEGEAKLVRRLRPVPEFERWDVAFRHPDGGWTDETYERVILPGR